MKFRSCLLVFVLIFSSCSYEPKKDHRTGKDKELKKYEAVLMLYFYKTVKEYKNAIDLLRETKVIYDDMVEVYYTINTIYNQMTKKQEVSFQALEKLQNQVEILDELLANADWPSEIHKRLQAIKGDIEFIQKALSESGTQALLEEPEKVAPVEEAPVSEEEPVQEPFAEEAPVSEEEPVQEPFAEEAPVSEEEPVQEPSVEEAPVSEEEPVQEPSVEEAPVSEEEPVQEPSVEEAPVSGEEPVQELSAEEAPVSEGDFVEVIPSISVTTR